MDLLVRAYYTFLGEFYYKVSTMDTSKTAAPSSIADITFVEVQLGKYIVKAWLVALLLEKAEKKGMTLEEKHLNIRVSFASTESGQ